MFITLAFLDATLNGRQRLSEVGFIKMRTRDKYGC